MSRKNHNPRMVHRAEKRERYDVDYVFLPECPEIAAIAVPMLKTIYRNMSCAPWADAVHEAKDDKDKYLTMIRRAI